MPSAPTVAIVKAKTEQVSFMVTVPEMVRLRIPGFGLRGEHQISTTTAASAPRTRVGAPANSATTSRETAARKLSCIGGLLQATAGTKVTLRRFNKGPLRVILERFDDKPVADFRGQESAVSNEFQRASWLLLEPSEECKGTPAQRFPINGIVEIGDELRPETSLDEPSSAPLLEGRIEIYGKTLNIGTFGIDSRARIYPVTDVALPPGSRVSEARPASGEPAKYLWSGMASFDPDEDAIQVELTTEASALSIMRPGIGMQPEILSIGMFAQLTNDPNILFGQFALAILIGITQLLGGFKPPENSD